MFSINYSTIYYKLNTHPSLESLGPTFGHSVEKKKKIFTKTALYVTIWKGQNHLMPNKSIFFSLFLKAPLPGVEPNRTFPRFGQHQRTCHGLILVILIITLFLLTNLINVTTFWHF